MRRSKLEIYVDVLRAINRGINKPTRIMFATNLSWKTLSEVLKNLEERELIEQRIVGRRKLFFITERGKIILNTFEAFAIEFANNNLTSIQQSNKTLKKKNNYPTLKADRF
ncbi:MAG: winged helix-turn-helix domain-containing protein [Candidatus Bathyarchaeia archaeon]|nr:winged helix DNA-binding protein [Candidatus Bathyarchaeota archaeon]